MGDVILIPKSLRMDWVDVMAIDTRVSNMAFRAAAVIGSHFNNQKGDAFLRLDTIAGVMGVSDRSVWGAVKELEDLGYLLVQRRKFGNHVRVRKDGTASEFAAAGGRGVANVYLPACERSQVTATFTGRKLATHCDHFWQERSQNRVRKVAAHCDPTLDTSSKYNSEGARARENGAHIIDGKMASGGSDPAGVWVHPGSPEFDAWIEAFTELGAKAAGEMRRCELEGRAFRVVSQWPPRRRSRSPLINAIDQVIDHLAAEPRRQS